MAELIAFESSWIWHPGWVEYTNGDSAGGFVHFKKSAVLESVPQTAVRLRITADTRYKLYVNSHLVSCGPVKGDEHRWFFDDVDIKPFLKPGHNHLAVHVLRFYHATLHASSFARMPVGGLRIVQLDEIAEVISLNGNETWETAIDHTVILRTDEPYDEFLHIFEQSDRSAPSPLDWVPAKPYRFQNSFGVTAPWKLHPRLIPFQSLSKLSARSVHNVRSVRSTEDWKVLLCNPSKDSSLCLPAGSSHAVELEFENHLTAFLALRFLSSGATGAALTITYSECYEDEPKLIPYVRVKSNRCDTTKGLYGPRDLYTLGGPHSPGLQYHSNEPHEEVIQPFHFRTFRFLTLQIQVPPGSDLVFKGLEVTKCIYPLRVVARFQADEAWAESLWDVSIRTLENCMHDCYEDCPFFEQLQYAFDTRSSSLFTYLVSGDDRLARQAMMQLHDSFQPMLGLTSSRAPFPKMQLQIIPHFSLYWICTVADHYEYYSDAEFITGFLPVCDAILGNFHSRILPGTGLVRDYSSPGFWEYVDWTAAWAPNGVPKAATRQGVSTYTNNLYAYTLKTLGSVLKHLDHRQRAEQYATRADQIVQAVQKHCYDGQFFTDGLASDVDRTQDYSQHIQIWAVLSGAALGETAVRILSQSFDQGDPVTQCPMQFDEDARPIAPIRSVGPDDPIRFTATSISFAFYKARAMAAAGADVYNKYFHDFWGLWREQLDNNLTTWAEDSVCVRSDCHAWGSVPISEFITEVAGVRPAAPGWSRISFTPRLSLFQKINVCVPVHGAWGSALIQVRWRRESDLSTNDVVIVELELKPDADISPPDIPIQVVLPNGFAEIRSSVQAISYRVNLRAAS